MVTFTELGRMGRLGNQLFQYAALRSISLEKGCKIKIPDPQTMEWQNQKCYLGNFNLNCEYLEPQDYSSIQYRFQEPHHAQFYPEVFGAPDNIDFMGYFQNYGYFSKHEHIIRQEFTLADPIKKEASAYLSKVRNFGDANADIVSVHIRRGDNVDGTNPEYANFYGDGDILCKESAFGKYFYSALETFNNKGVKFLVFSGGSRKGDAHNQSDIEWCKQNFKGDNVYYCEGNKDIVDFEIMRQCDHNITCHMTSFGWWAAFLNDNPDKVVVAPRSYSIPDDGRASIGFYPPAWKLI
tara:strand:+ start:4487 stop:5371 length:885 start_codon:yes stop_codon:yes gene_type:complete